MIQEHTSRRAASDDEDPQLLVCFGISMVWIGVIYYSKTIAGRLLQLMEAVFSQCLHLPSRQGEAGDFLEDKAMGDKEEHVAKVKEENTTHAAVEGKTEGLLVSKNLRTVHGQSGEEEVVHLTRNSDRPAFRLFSNLPVELQLIIWEFARPDPRVVKLVITRDHRNLISRAPIPAMLQTCHTSRMVALKWYKLSFKDVFRHRSEAKVLFDPTADYLYQGCAACAQETLRRRVGSTCPDRCGYNTVVWCENLKVKKVVLEVGPQPGFPIADAQLDFKELEELVIIDSPGQSAPLAQYEHIESDVLWNCRKNLQEAYEFERNFVQTFDPAMHWTIKKLSRAKYVGVTGDRGATLGWI